MPGKKIKPEPVPLYPVEESLDNAWELIASRLPITDVNELKSSLMTYHNTLLSELDIKSNENNSI